MSQASSSSVSAPPAPPSRANTVGSTVRRLARRISLSVLRGPASPPADGSNVGRRSRSNSVASVRVEDARAGAGPAAGVARPKSRLQLMRRSVFGGGGGGSGGVAGVVEEAEDEGQGDASDADRRRPAEQPPPVTFAWTVPKAWAFKHGERTGYDLAPLLYGRKVSELWFPGGDTLVFLCSRSESQRYGPSFKFSSGTLRKKSEFFDIATSERWQDGHAEQQKSLLASERAKYVLYFPPWEDDLATDGPDGSRKVDTEDDFYDLCVQLISTRNFFAFLFDRFCIGLSECGTNSAGSQSLSDLMERMEMYVLTYIVPEEEQKLPLKELSEPASPSDAILDSAGSSATSELRPENPRRASLPTSTSRRRGGGSTSEHLSQAGQLREYHRQLWMLEQPPQPGPSSSQDAPQRITDQIRAPSGRDLVLQKLGLWIRSNNLDDARNAPRRLVDVLIVSERYQWEDIFTEAFMHGAGMFDALSSLDEYANIPHATRQLLERASFSIKARVASTTSLLSRLNFSILVPTSATSIRRSHRGDTFANPFPSWRRGYKSFRKFVMAYYTKRFHLRSWPPKVWTRGMIKQLQRDFGALFDLLIDNDDTTDPYRHLLSIVLRDFEESSFEKPQGPLWFPRLPALPSETSPNWGKKQGKDEIAVTLMDSYNSPSASASGNRFVEAFIEAFKVFERDYGQGRTVTESVIAREGRWCLVYAVVRTLAAVCHEWDGLKYEREVEYWLCAELKGVPPWRETKRAGGGWRERNVRETGGTGVFGRSQSRAE